VNEQKVTKYSIKMSFIVEKVLKFCNNEPLQCQLPPRLPRPHPPPRDRARCSPRSFHPRAAPRAKCSFAEPVFHWSGLGRQLKF
jgi:hypothetical protein